MPSKYAQAQVRILETLKDYGLLEMAIAGKLPPHIEKAAKQSVISDMPGLKCNEDKTSIYCTADEHDEAQREIDEYVRHYKLIRDLKEAIEKQPPRVLRKGVKYSVKRGYFTGRMVIYKGTDLEVWGAGWLDSPGNPACEKYIFRAQRDRLDINKIALVFNLPAETRDIILQEQEIGQEVN